jgi:hypothetical protein
MSAFQSKPVFPAVILAKARIQFVQPCEACKLDAYGAVYTLDSGLRRNDGVV